MTPEDRSRHSALLIGLSVPLPMRNDPGGDAVQEKALYAVVIRTDRSTRSLRAYASSTSELLHDIQIMYDLRYRRRSRSAIKQSTI